MSIHQHNDEKGGRPPPVDSRVRCDGEKFRDCEYTAVSTAKSFGQLEKTTVSRPKSFENIE